MARDLEFDRDYGHSIAGRWVPAPRYALRRRRILALTQAMRPGRMLETGPGAAALLRDFAARGFDCTGCETSDAAHTVARRMVGDLPNVELVREPRDDWPAKFDYLLSCDVLEHIENDQHALNEWAGYLRPGGTAIIAVPCHMRKFGPLDEWAGHLRRYEKPELVQLLTKSGLELLHFETYGFPLANMTSMLRNRMLRKPQARRTVRDASADTAQSGVERHTENRLYRFQVSLPGRLVMRAAFALQYLFRSTEFGDGFIVIARKAHDSEHKVI